MFKCTGVCARCGHCRNGSMMKGANDRKTKLLSFPGDFRPAPDGFGYAMAFDIGTTTVVGMLWDLAQGKLLGQKALTNPQNEFGMDVISRITYAQESAAQLAQLRRLIIDCLEEISRSLCEDQGIVQESILRVAVCGNTTMSHLFAGEDPKTLARAPFQPAYTGMKIFTGEESGLTMAAQGKAILIPNIAGHVGGDITAGILASRLQDRAGETLFIDIGTNGEIVYHREDTMLVCSTAAGPAFEGAAIYQGMRAAVGAIERIRFTSDDVHFRVIGGVPPVGICGSGLIDAVSEMIRCGIVDSSGRIVTPDVYCRKHAAAAALASRIREGENGREFVLVAKENDEDIVIVQNDIREVQLAKAAVAAGIKLMMKRAGSRPEALDEVLIAGAFGSYIDKHSAVRIGLLPSIDEDRIHFLGNTAGAGTLMTAISEEEEEKVCRIPALAEHVELAEDPDFQTVYLGQMAFKA